MRRVKQPCIRGGQTRELSVPTRLQRLDLIHSAKRSRLRRLTRHHCPRGLSPSPSLPSAPSPSPLPSPSASPSPPPPPVQDAAAGAGGTAQAQAQGSAARARQGTAHRTRVAYARASNGTLDAGGDPGERIRSGASLPPPLPPALVYLHLYLALELGARVEKMQGAAAERRREGTCLELGFEFGLALELEVHQERLLSRAPPRAPPLHLLFGALFSSSSPRRRRCRRSRWRASSGNPKP
jgi:hypothetical protein